MSKNKSNINKGNFGKIIAFFVCIIIIFLIKVYFIGFFFISSSSMFPTLQIGDMVLVNKMSNKELNKYDIVFFFNKDKNRNMVKRIIALEGDTVRFLNDNIYVNNVDIRYSDFFDLDWLNRYKEVCVPKGEVFLVGDNYNVSEDSRDWGTIKKDAILGKVFFIYYSKNEKGFHFDRIGRINN